MKKKILHKPKFFKHLLTTSSLLTVLIGSINSASSAQDTITTLTGNQSFLSVPSDWTKAGAPGTPPNNDPGSMVFLTQAQDLNFDVNTGNLGTINLYGFDGQTIHLTQPNSLQDIINDYSAPMIARVKAGNGGVAIASPGTAGARAAFDINFNGTVDINGSNLAGLGNILLSSVNTEVKLNGNNSVINSNVDSYSAGNGYLTVNAQNVQLNGNIGATSPINGLKLLNNSSANLLGTAAFDASGMYLEDNSELTVLSGQNFTFNNGASIYFAGNGTLHFSGDYNTNITTNITANNTGKIIYDGTAGQALTITGQIGNNGGKLDVVDITAGGTLKLTSNNGTESYINTIDMGGNDGNIVLNRQNFNIDNIAHTAGKGSIIISDENVSAGNAATVAIFTNFLGTSGNPLNGIRFVNTGGGAEVNVAMLGNPVEIHASSITTDTANTGVLLFGQGYNLVNAPVGTAPLPLLAIGINSNTTVELAQDVFLKQTLIMIPYEIGLTNNSLVRIRGNVAGDIVGLDNIMTSTPVVTFNGTAEWVNNVPVILDGDIVSTNTVRINGSDVTFTGNIKAQTLEFNQDSNLIIPGNSNVKIEISNVNANANNVGTIRANNITGINTLEIVGNIGNNNNKIKGINITGGGTLSLVSPTPGSNNVENYIGTIDMGVNNGTLKLNSVRLFLDNLVNAAGKGRVIIADDGTGPNDAAVVEYHGQFLGTSANPLAEIRFKNTAVNGPLVNVLFMDFNSQIHAASIETDVAEKGIIIFMGGNHVVNAPIGSVTYPLAAIPINVDTTVDFKKEIHLRQNIPMLMLPFEIGISNNSTVRIWDNVTGDISGIAQFLTSPTPIISQNGTVETVNTVPITIDGSIAPVVNIRIKGADVTVTGDIDTQTLEFVQNSRIILPGSSNRTIIAGNINAPDIGAIEADDIPAGGWISFSGNIGNNNNKLDRIAARGGGSIKFINGNVNVNYIDVSGNDGTIEFHNGEHNFNFLHYDKEGTIVINAAFPGSYTQFDSGTVISAPGNRLKRLLFKDNGSNSLFNVASAVDNFDIYADSIETDTAGSGVLLFAGGMNIIDAPIGGSLLPIRAIGVRTDGAILELRQDAYLAGIAIYDNSIVKIKGNIYTGSDVLINGIFGIDSADLNMVNKGRKGTVEFINTSPVTMDGNIEYVNVIRLSGHNVTISGNAAPLEFNFSNSSQEAILQLQSNTIIDNKGITTAGNNLHTINFRQNVEVAAPIGSDLNRLKNVIFSSDNTKIAVLKDKIYSQKITTTNSHLVVVENSELHGDIVGNNSNFDLSNRELIYSGRSTLTGPIVFSTTFDGTNGGHITIVGNGSNLDFSGTTKSTVILNAVSSLPPANGFYQFVLFDSQGGTVTPGNITFVSNEANRFVVWRYDSNTYIITSAKNLDIVGDVINAGGSSSNIAVAAALSDPNATGAAAAIQNALGLLTSAQAAALVASLTPNLDTSGIVVAEASDRAEQSAQARISNQLFASSDEVFAVAAGDEDNNKYGLWGAPYYGKSRQDTYNSEPGYTTTSYGGTVGGDSRISENLSLGVAFSLTHTNVKHRDSKGGDRGKVSGQVFSLYGLQQFDTKWFMQGIGFLGFSKLNNVEERRLTPTTLLNARYKYKSTSYGIQLLTGKKCQLSESILLTPLAGLRFTHSRDGSYQETGAGILNLKVGKKKLSSLEAIVGAKLTASTVISNLVVKPELQLLVNYDIKTRPMTMVINIDGLPNPIRIKSQDGTKAWYNLGAGVNVINKAMEYGAHYDLQLDKKYVGQQLVLKLKVNF